jgi:hypothetical protein
MSVIHFGLLGWSFCQPGNTKAVQRIVSGVTKQGRDIFNQNRIQQLDLISFVVEEISWLLNLNE